MESKVPLPVLPKEPKKQVDNIAVWSEMTSLQRKYGCMSLGEGAPGYPTPKFMKDFMKEAIDEEFNQYCRTFGVPELTAKIAQHYGK